MAGETADRTPPFVKTHEGTQTHDEASLGHAQRLDRESEQQSKLSGDGYDELGTAISG